MVSVAKTMVLNDESTKNNMVMPQNMSKNITMPSRFWNIY